MPPRLVVITGSSGVGKSTLARALQEQLLPDQWLHFSFDTLFYCLPSSIVLRVDQHNDRSLVDSRAIAASSHACVRTLIEREHKVIFDTVIMSENGANGVRQAFEEYDPMYVALTCSWEQIRNRTLARGDRTIEEAEFGFKNAGRHLRANHTFDTTGATPEEIAARLAVHVRASAIGG